MNNIKYQVLLRNIDNDYSEYVTKIVELERRGIERRERTIKTIMLRKYVQLINEYKVYDRMGVNPLTCTQYDNIIRACNVIMGKTYTSSFCEDETINNNKLYSGNKLVAEITT